MTISQSVVGKKARGLIKESWQSQANLSVFLGLLILVVFVLPSLGFGSDDLKLYIDLVFSLVLVSGVAIAWGRWKLFLLAALVSAVTLAIRWMAFFSSTPELKIRSGQWSVAAVLVIALVLLMEVFRDGPVTHSRIQGAIAVYLLFGIGWAHAYHIIDLLHPAAFTTTAGPLSNVTDWVYYSFVTLSTVGYGDITAVDPIARMLSVAEALTGQLFLAVLIARLVAMEVVSWQSKHTRDVN